MRRAVRVWRLGGTEPHLLLSLSTELVSGASSRVFWGCSSLAADLVLFSLLRAQSYKDLIKSHLMARDGLRIKEL